MVLNEIKGFEIGISENFPFIDFYLYQHNGYKVSVVEPVEGFTLRTIRETESPQPTLRMDRRMALEMMKKFVEVLEKEDIKTDNQTKAEAKLEVTEKWLEDMRKLVFD